MTNREYYNIDKCVVYVFLWTWTYQKTVCLWPIGGNKLIREKEKEHLFFDKTLENKEFGPSLKDLLQAVKVK